MESSHYKPYFVFQPDIRYVPGACLGALYDLKAGDVFSLDLNGRLIVEQILDGTVCSRIPDRIGNGLDDQEVASFLAQLQRCELGGMSETPASRTHHVIFPEEKPKLRKLWMEVTPGCNLRCIHCYADAEPLSPVQDSRMCLRQWKTAIDDACAQTPPAVQIIGGEPLTCGKRFLKELFSHARRAGIEAIELFTNGTLIDEEWAGIIAGNSVSVAFSIYSKNAVTHDTITGVPGSHRKLLDRIDLLLRHGVPLRPGFVLMEENENEEDETMQWLQASFGVALPPPDVIRCTPESRCSQGRHFTRQLWQRKLRTRACFSSVGPERFALHQAGHPCLMGALCIHYDGSVYPCVMDRTRCLGNLTRNCLSEIMESDSVIDVWRQSLCRIDTCRDCEFRFACIDCRPEVAGVDSLLNNRANPDFSVKNPCCLYDPHTGVWRGADEVLDALTRISSSALKPAVSDKHRPVMDIGVL